MHVCIDDCSRIAVTGIFPDEKATSAIACLRGAVAYYVSLGIKVSRVMPPSRRLQAIACRAMDNGSCYKAKTFAAACKALNLNHIRTKPYTPKTNGKAERFIQTALRERAYARACQTSDQRKRHLPDWTHMYNWRRHHGGIGSKPPISRLALAPDNLLRLHSQSILAVPMTLAPVQAMRRPGLAAARSFRPVIGAALVVSPDRRPTGIFGGTVLNFAIRTDTRKPCRPSDRQGVRNRAKGPPVARFALKPRWLP